MAISGVLDSMSSHQTDDETATILSEIYSELRPMASRLMSQERKGHTLSPTSLIHEAVIRLMRSSLLHSTADRHHVLGAAVKAMREVLVDYARHRNAARRGRGYKRVPLDVVIDYFEDQSLDILAVNEALDRLAELNLRQSQVISLRYFGGMSIPEIASALEVSVGTVERDWRIARAWLNNQLRGVSEKG